jgi:hypothetical protein
MEFLAYGSTDKFKTGEVNVKEIHMGAPQASACQRISPGFCSNAEWFRGPGVGLVSLHSRTFWVLLLLVSLRTQGPLDCRKARKVIWEKVFHSETNFYRESSLNGRKVPFLCQLYGKEQRVNRETDGSHAFYKLSSRSLLRTARTAFIAILQWSWAPKKVLNVAIYFRFEKDCGCLICFSKVLIKHGQIRFLKEPIFICQTMALYGTASQWVSEGQIRLSSLSF